MRITHDSTPLELILTLCSPAGVTAEDTAEFFGMEIHSSHDWLIDAWTEKVDIILDCFKRYGHDVTPLQGLGDKGVDILLQTSLEKDSHTSYRVGFQLKSNREAKENRKNSDESPEGSLTKVMKRQFAEATQIHRVDEWWFIQCFDYIKYKKLVLTNHSELPPNVSRGITVRHIGPRSAYAFLSRSNEKITALCLLYLCTDDEILKAATAEVEDLSPLADIVVRENLWDGLDRDNDDPVRIGVRELMNYAQELDDENVEDGVNELESMKFLIRDSDSSFRISPFAFPALCALYFEARVRHQLSHRNAANFACSLLDAEKLEKEDEFPPLP